MKRVLTTTLCVFLMTCAQAQDDLPFESALMQALMMAASDSLERRGHAVESEESTR